MTAPPGSRADSGYRLLLRSIGTADASVIPTLRPLRRATDRELAALVYRAPSELLANLDHETGRRLVDALRGTGVEVDLVSMNQPFLAGQGDHELAVGISRFNNMLELIETTMRLLGADLDSAQRLLCASPAVLIGGVSAATATAFEKRFAPLGAELDLSITASAVFDVAVDARHHGAARQILSDLLPEAAQASRSDGAEPFLATGLDSAAAEVLWNALARTPAKARILNRDFQRFDVVLNAAPESSAMVELLVATTGMSETRAARSLTRVPFVLVENVRGTRMAEILTAVRASGGTATGVLLALATFGLAVEPGGDRDGARPWVEAIAGKAAAQEFFAERSGHAGGSSISGPLAKTQARWLQHQLRTYAIDSRLVER